MSSIVVRDAVVADAPAIGLAHVLVWKGRPVALVREYAPGP